MSNNIPKSKYDEHGRPIKKGIFSSSTRRKSTTNYSKNHQKHVKKEDNFALNKDLEKIKTRLNNSFDEIKDDFNNDSRTQKEKDIEALNTLKPLALAIVSFMIPFVGFAFAIVAINLANKNKTTENQELMMIAKIIAIISLVFSVFGLGMSMFTLFLL